MAQPTSRTPSRPSSRNSLRASTASPGASPEDPVFLRNQMSTLKHEIRLKQAQFNTLEAQLQRVPRPLPPDLRRSPSPPLYNFALSAFGTSTPRKRPSSLSRHEEGIPMLSVSKSTGNLSKRNQSPTRSRNRIPVSAVSHGRALAENGTPIPTVDEPTTNGVSTNGGPSSYLDPPSPNGGNSRKALGGGNTTKVLADLQTGVVNARKALENTKIQLRLAQRSVATLTRENEDLKDGRERLRLENESLNNVVSRKDRLLHEVLERARKAEAEALELKFQLKKDNTEQKKEMKRMQDTMVEATTLSEKAQREYVTLKDSFDGLQGAWKADMEAIRTQVAEREEQWKKEIEDVNLKYRGLVKLTQAAQAERAKMESLKTEQRKLDAKFEEAFKEELRSLAEAIADSSKSAEETQATAKETADELGRIRRLMRMAERYSDHNSPIPGS